eukprot:9138902-Pyramimonas_sp.AAC.1
MASSSTVGTDSRALRTGRELRGRGYINPMDGRAVCQLHLGFAGLVWACTKLERGNGHVYVMRVAIGIRGMHAFAHTNWPHGVNHEEHTKTCIRP